MKKKRQRGQTYESSQKETIPKRGHYCRCWLLPVRYNMSYREVQELFHDLGINV